MDNLDYADLDELQPQPKNIKFGGNIITVNQPTTAQTLRLGALANKLENVADLDDESIDQLCKRLGALIGEIIPELLDVNLNISQLLAIVGVLGDMTMPASAKELKKKA